MKQEKVPCLADNDARLALDPKDPFSILTKPHGHGDVHLLMHSSKTLESWEAAGIKCALPSLPAETDAHGQRGFLWALLLPFPPFASLRLPSPPFASLLIPSPPFSSLLLPLFLSPRGRWVYFFQDTNALAFKVTSLDLP